MYVYTPPHNKRQATVISAILFAAAALTFMFGNFLPMRLIWQVVAIGTLTAGILITSRFVLTEYRYKLNDLAHLHESNQLIVESVQGKNVKTVCSLTLETRVGFAKYESLKQIEEKYGHISRSFSYSPNLFSESKYAYIFEFNDETNMILLDCDDEFVRQFRMRTEVMDVGEE